MKKKVYSLFLAALAMTSFQVVAQEVNASIQVGFENGQMVDGVDFKNGFGSATMEVVENPVGFDGWDGADAPADELNFSEMALFVELPAGANAWDGPAIRLKGPNGEDGVTVSALDPSTHFLHIQMLLPEGTVTGKGTFVFNLYTQTIDGNNAMEPRLLHDSGNADVTNIKYPSDYKAMTWVEFDVDLRPYLGNTVRKIQIQGERGGSKSYYIDNITLDNRRKNFKEYDFGTNIPIVEEADQMLIFYPGTKCCLTAQDQPAKGFAQTTFEEYDADNYYQVWNVTVDSEMKQADGSDLYTVEYDYSYLYNDGTLRSSSESGNMRWFATQYKNNPKHQDPLMINAGTWKYIRPRFWVDGVETEATKDTIGWKFVKLSEVDEYLATVTKEIEKQPENGDYVIFYAGTNYCITDPRNMSWYKGTDGADSIYIPVRKYSVLLEEYNPENTAVSQVWEVKYYSDLIDNEETREYFDFGAQVNGLPTLNETRYYWSYKSDSTTRAVGARMFFTKPFDLVWKDANNEEHTIYNNRNVFSDNAQMNNWENNNAWFVKQIPMNKDGKCAIYRPNNGFQVTDLQARYAGGALYAKSTSTQDPNSNELKQYVWKFVPADDAVLASKESAKSLIDKDTVFGYPTEVPAGNYRIVYRGTNQALAINSAATTNYKGLTAKTFDKEDADQIFTIAPVTEPKAGWEGYENQFYMNVGDFRIINNPAQTQWVYLYTPELAAAHGMKEEESYFRALMIENSSVYGCEKAYILYANEKLKKFLRINNPVNNTGIAQFNSTGTITVNGRVWPEFNMVLQSVDADLPTITREFPEQLPLLEQGFYYFQYAFANDATDQTKPYVLAPPTPSAQDAFTVLAAYDAEQLDQQWYVAYSDTANLRKVQEGVEDAKIDTRYFLFASAEVRDTIAKGATTKDLIELPNGEAFVMNDWNKVAQNRNFDWFTYRFYSKEGKISLKESQHNRWLADHVSLGTGIYKLTGDQTRSNNGVDDSGWESKRTYVWHLVKAGEEFAPVSELAPWHPDYSVEAITLGDANGDGQVNVSDVVATVNYVVGTPAEDFVMKAADVNGDAKINVTDVVSIANIILGSDNNPSMEPATGSLAIEGENVMLTSTAAIGGFDFAYEGDLTATEALKDFTVVTYVKAGQARLIAYTLERGVLNAGTSALFSTTGVTISDMLFVAENATELTMSDDVVTSEGVITAGTCTITVSEGVVTATGATAVEVYTVEGTLVGSSETSSVSVATLAPATYVVKATTEAGVVVEKVVIK